MKITLILIAFLFQSNLFAQNELPQKVYSIIKVYKTYDWYTTQASLWEKEVKKRKKDQTAWTNYYTAVRMAKITAPDNEKRDFWFTKMQTVVKQVEKTIPNTFTYYHIKSWQSNIWGETDMTKVDEMIGWAKKAYDLDPENPAVYPDLMNAHLINGSKDDLKSLSKKWLSSGDIDPNLLALNYNVFASVEKNAILITAGDNDTYPAYALQYGQNIRPDIKVMNYYCATGSKKYRNHCLKEMGLPETMTDFTENIEIVQYILDNKGDRPIYFAFGTYMDNEDSLKDKLYSTGLALKYSEFEMSNTALLIHNFEHKFLLDHLKINLYTTNFPEQVKRHNLTYIPGFMQVYHHYCAIEDSKKAADIEALIRKIVANSPHEEEVLKAFDK